MPLLLPVLPADFHVRPPTLTDATIVVALFNTCQQSEFGTSDITEVDMLKIWQAPEVDLRKDIWLIFSLDEQLVAYLHLGHREHSRMQIVLKVHPDYAHLDLQTSLLACASERASQLIDQVLPDVRISLYTVCSGPNHLYRKALEQASFVYSRSDWRMEIALDEPPPMPVWPEGIALRPFTMEMARAVHAADEEAFSDHWGFIPGPFETFAHWFFTTPGFDPTLWFIPFAGEKIAGSALCEYKGNIAWVNSLSVLRPWRRKGLGLALLYHAFGEFYRRGYRRATLNVDSQNLTGATRLYERAGMHAVRQFDRYEKELRPGTELSVQALTE